MTISHLPRRFMHALRWLFSDGNCKRQKAWLKLLFFLCASLGGFVFKGVLDNPAFRRQSPAYTYFEEAVGKLGDGRLTFDGAVLHVATLSLAAVLFVMAMSCVAMLAQGVRKTRRVGVPHGELCQGTPEALKFLERHGESASEYRTIGGVIEIARHPDIIADPAFSGWNCMSDPQRGGCEVRIEHDLGRHLKVDASLIAHIRPPQGHNGLKYSLVSAPLDYSDAYPKLDLLVHKTDYSTVMRFNELIRGAPAERSRLGSIYPEENRVPNSLCLHYLVRLADGNILCMRRKANTAYQGGLLSATGEEQLAHDDVAKGPELAMAHWFRRALCEEVYPLRGIRPGSVDSLWKDVEPHVDAMRVYSVFYEEMYCNFSLFGFVSLTLDTEEYRQSFLSLSRRHGSGRDREGKFYVMSKAEAMSFLKTGGTTVTSLWNPEDRLRIGTGGECSLHLSFRYRLLTYMISTGSLAGVPAARRGGGCTCGRCATKDAEIARLRNALAQLRHAPSVACDTDALSPNPHTASDT